MSAGLATDDPWGDRQQGLALDAFERFLASGPPFAWPPGTTFEYSNLGYGILGRVVTAAGGQEYGDLVRDRILGAARHGVHGLPRGGRPGGAPRPRLRAARRVADPRGERPVRRARVDGRRVLVDPRPRPLGGGIPGRLPRPRRPRGRPSAPARLAARDAAGPSPRRAVAARPPGPRRARRRRRWATASASSSTPTPSWGRSCRTPAATRVSGPTWPGTPRPASGVIGLGNLRYAPVRPVVAEQLRALVLADAVPRRRVRPARADRGVPGARGGPARALGRRGRRRGVRDEHGPRRAAGRAPRRRPADRGRPGPVPARCHPAGGLALAGPPRVVAAWRRRLGPSRAARLAGARGADPAARPDGRARPLAGADRARRTRSWRSPARRSRRGPPDVVAGADVDVPRRRAVAARRGGAVRADAARVARRPATAGRPRRSTWTGRTGRPGSRSRSIPTAAS